LSAVEAPPSKLRHIEQFERHQHLLYFVLTILLIALWLALPLRHLLGFIATGITRRVNASWRGFSGG
jgi:hypothetical protein